MPLSPTNKERLPMKNDVENALLDEVATTGRIVISGSKVRFARLIFRISDKIHSWARRELMRNDLARYYRLVIFGSARLPEDSQEYKFIRDLSYAVVDTCRTDIVSGGGPSLMTAALEGLYLARQNAQANGRIIKAKGIGVTLVTLPNGEKPNEFAEIQLTQEEFPPRLQAFGDYGSSYYIGVGAIGTKTEESLVTQWVQVGHIRQGTPVMAHPSWRRIIATQKDEWHTQRILRGLPPLMGEKDLDFFTYTDSIPEIVDIVSKHRDQWRQSINRHVVKVF